MQTVIKYNPAKRNPVIVRSSEEISSKLRSLALKKERKR